MCVSQVQQDGLEMVNASEVAGVYTTDEFRMYCYKVLPCSKRTLHNWQACPFAHYGEHARRRDVRTRQYSSALCPDVKRESGCPRGDGCHMSHNIFESWLHPEQYRTQLCTAGRACTRTVCFFAHAPEELRMTSKLPKPTKAAAEAATAASMPVQQLNTCSTSTAGLPLTLCPSAIPACPPLDSISSSSSSSSSVSGLGTPMMLLGDTGCTPDAGSTRRLLVNNLLMPVARMDSSSSRRSSRIDCNSPMGSIASNSSSTGCFHIRQTPAHNLASHAATPEQLAVQLQLLTLQQQQMQQQQLAPVPLTDVSALGGHAAAAVSVLPATTATVLPAAAPAAVPRSLDPILLLQLQEAQIQQQHLTLLQQEQQLRQQQQKLLQECTVAGGGYNLLPQQQQQLLFLLA